MNTPAEQYAIRNAVTISLKHDRGFECAKVTCIDPETAARVQSDWDGGADIDAIETHYGKNILVSYAK